MFPDKPEDPPELAPMPITGTYADRRQEERLKNLPLFVRSSLQRLAYEIAAELEDPERVFERYGYTEEQALVLAEDPEFVTLYQHAVKELRDNAGSFRIKCRTMAEMLLENSYEMATDPDCPANVRADLIKWTAKMAELEPKTGKDEGGRGAGGGLTIAITFAGGQKEVIGAREPITIENGEA